MTAPFKLGVTLYSYTGDYGVTMTLEDCIADAVDAGARASRSWARPTSRATRTPPTPGWSTGMG